MGTRIDQLFSGKLAVHSMAPPPNAWARIESNLSKKNNGVIWFRWAAILIPVLIGLSVFWIKYASPSTTTIASTTIKKQNSISGKKTDKEVKTEKENMPIDVVPPKTQRATVNNLVSKTVEDKNDTSVVFQNVPAVLSEEVEITQATTSPTIHAPETVVASSDAKKEKGIVLEYTLGGDEPSTAMPAEKPITLTMELKETKTLRKVVDFARGAKNSEGPFATIRQAKEDLFAFNFKKDKPKNK